MIDINRTAAWWKEEDDAALGSSVQSTVDTLVDSQSWFRDRCILSAKMYDNSSLIPSGRPGLGSSIPLGMMTDRATFNVVQSCIDTVVSKMSQSKPKPQFLTTGGKFKQRRRAKKLNKFVDGVFYENGYYDLATQVFRDAAIFGTGVVHVFGEGDKVKFERVLPTELMVDQAEVVDGAPRQLHRLRSVDRDVLKAWLASLGDAALASEEALDMLPEETNLDGTRALTSNLTTVRESWHLPSGPDSEDGLHVISAGNLVLFKEEWTRDEFPFAFMHWLKPVHGFWGKGLPALIQGIQFQINQILLYIQRSFEMGGTFKIFLQQGSKIDKAKINDQIGTIITGTGNAPQWLVPPLVQPEIYQHLRTLKDMAYEQCGVSQMAAASVKPAGLDSGKALRTFNDIQSERFATVSYQYQQLAVDVGRLAVAALKELQMSGAKPMVRLVGSRSAESLFWKDVSMDSEDLVVKCYPVSSLPDDPAGRLQTIQEYAQAGYISPRTARRLLDFPDLEQIEDLANAQEELLHIVFERMTEEGIYSPPEPYDDLNLARELCLQYMAEGRSTDLEEERLELLRQYLEALDQMMASAEEVAAPPAVEAPAAPLPPPTSELLPNGVV